VGGFFRIPIVRTLHERQLLLPAVVILVVSGVLAQGAFVKNQPVEASSPDVRSAPVAPPVVRRPDLEKTPLTYFDDYWRQLRERVEGSIVLVGPGSVPAVVVLPGLAITSAEAGEAVLAEMARARMLVPPPDADPDQPSVAADDTTEPTEGPESEDEPVVAEAALPASDPSHPYGLVAVDSDRGMSLFAVADADALLLVPPAAVPSGSYVAAVSRDRAGRAAIAPGHLVAARADSQPQGDPSLAVSMTVPAWGATAVVNLDGALVGVGISGANPGRGPRLFSSSVVRRLVGELQRPVLCRPLEVTELGADVLELLDIDAGLLIEQVRQDAFRPEPSLHAGDILLEWGGEPVTTVDAFETRAAASVTGELNGYRILRGRRQLTGNTILPAQDCQPIADPPVQLLRYGLALRWAGAPPQDATGGWRVGATVDGGPAALAGIQLDDLVIAIDGRPVADPDARALFERLEQRGESAIVTFQRADHVRMVAVVPLDGATN
jgi:S1-C subfamily serine protease